MDRKTVSAYLAGNRLFYDCLQVATVDNRAAVEDMILNTPEA